MNIYIFQDTRISLKLCEGWDLNPRNPSIPDLKSGAFDQLGNPRMKNSCSGSIPVWTTP